MVLTDCIKRFVKIIETYQIKQLDDAIRFNVYCEKNLDSFHSRKSIKKSIAKGEIRLNSKKKHGGTLLRIDDIITVIDLEETPPKTYHLKLNIVYEDNYLAVINKPAGLTVSGNQFKTLANALIYNLNESPEKDKLPWPLPVHRLDNQTSGLVIVAKTKKARVELGQMFENKTIEKVYNAIVMGAIEENGSLDYPIDDKPSKTIFETLEIVPSIKNNFISLVKLHPKTGRTHQIRIHLATLGFPILGDKLYSNRPTINHKGLFLVALELRFKHPITEQNLLITINLPPKFKSRMKNEKRMWEAFHSDKL